MAKYKRNDIRSGHRKCLVAMQMYIFGISSRFTINSRGTYGLLILLTTLRYKHASHILHFVRKHETSIGYVLALTYNSDGVNHKRQMWRGGGGGGGCFGAEVPLILNKAQCKDDYVYLKHSMRC